MVRIDDAPFGLDHVFDHLVEPSSAAALDFHVASGAPPRERRPKRS